MIKYYKKLSVFYKNKENNMKNLFLNHYLSALDVGVVSAKASFAAEPVVKLDTKNENLQKILEKADDLVADKISTELKVNIFLNKNQK